MTTGMAMHGCNVVYIKYNIKYNIKHYFVTICSTMSAIPILSLCIVLTYALPAVQGAHLLDFINSPVLDDVERFRDSNDDGIRGNSASDMWILDNSIVENSGEIRSKRRDRTVINKRYK